MVSCASLYEISAKLAHALQLPDQPFGGMNMIFAGDFAQLPPVMAQPLYAPGDKPLLNFIAKTSELIFAHELRGLWAADW
ncbi:hypothetical protein B0H11DRAFT_2261533 [Mycena galericulata]|nr:hypothetical protein B0H11DRAFT_2261533 [Mycena galericulata]